MLSRRTLFALAHSSRPFKSRRTFGSFWQRIVRDSPARHLRHSIQHLVLPRQHEQSAPCSPARPAHLSETVKICQDRAGSESQPPSSPQHPATLNSPPTLHQPTCTSSSPRTLIPSLFTHPTQPPATPPVHFHRRASPDLSQRQINRASTHPPDKAKPERLGATRTSSSGTSYSTQLTHRAGLSTCMSYRDGVAPLTGLLRPRRITT